VANVYFEGDVYVLPPAYVPDQDDSPDLLCTAWQLRRAINASATVTRAAVDTAIANASQDLKDAWAVEDLFYQNTR